jgi:hypothetical protein
MAGPLFDAVERAQLSDLLGELGPEAPTLLAPWMTRDVAAHLVLRERDYLAGPGLVLPGAWGWRTYWVKAAWAAVLPAAACSMKP